MKQRMLCRTLTDFGVLCQFKSEEKQNLLDSHKFVI
jgi:hypothetical protein